MITYTVHNSQIYFAYFWEKYSLYIPEELDSEKLEIVYVEKYDLDYFLLFRRHFGFCLSSDRRHRLKFLNCSIFPSLAFNASYKRSRTIIYYLKLYSLAHLLSYECFLCS